MDITIAVSNLADEAWAKQFFPEDLPKDWQLDFYSNEFSSLLSNNETLKLPERENYLSVIEGVHLKANRLDSTDQLINVEFPQTKPVEVCPDIQLSQAKITSKQNITGTVCILRVASDRKVVNNELKELLMHIRSNYSEYDRVCVFLDRSMQRVEIIEACKIINDLL